jgi:hypothetical protein
MNLRNLQNSSFDNFDPTLMNSFDPTLLGKYNNAAGDTGAGSTAVNASPGQKMQLNITLNNPTAKTLSFELFNYLKSYVRVLNTSYVNGTYLYIPLLTYEGLTRFKAAPDHGGTIGFNAAGDLEIRGDTAVPDPTATIGCGEIPYAGLFEASAVTPFAVAFLRFTCVTNQQIDQNIVWFQNSYSGGVVENRINPRAYFKPNQFQSFTIDITVQFPIGIDKGLRTQLLPSEVVTLAFFIQMWTNQTLG